ncbi:MAG: insulinase family protein [Acidimicrobiales bacterium]|nr:insulinase family protein [Acidimicrobiales bacterium]
MLEDDDQSGAAHFLEHMLFNGTDGFPGNELQTVLVVLGLGRTDEQAVVAGLRDAGHRLAVLGMAAPGVTRTWACG